VGAYGSAELASRIVRLAATVVIARQLAPEIVGEAALALTIFEILRVLERTGTGQKLVSVGAERLDAACNTANRVCWWWTWGLVLAQLGGAALLYFAFNRVVAAGILASLAAVYLFMAGGHVQFWLALRAGENGALARISATQAIADHILTACLLLLWPSPWSLALPKLLTAPLWLILVRRAQGWTPRPEAGHIPLGEMLRYSGGILASEAMMALRTQGDNLIIAATLGTTALGTYYFAFNAGLGIVTSLVSAFGSVAFPMLCREETGAPRIAALRRVILLAIVGFLPLILLQSFAAPFYVPLVFGAKWEFAAPLIATLCLAGVPLLISTIISDWLRAEGNVGRDAVAATLGAVAALTGLYIGASTGSLIAAASGLVMGQAWATCLYVAQILIPVLRPAPQESAR
jgi:O-antigen/teichoic acid export membrane protein